MGHWIEADKWNEKTKKEIEMSFNKITLMGRMGNDIELKKVGEHTVGKFTMATSKKRKGEEVTQWHSVQIWNKSAEAISNYCGKGKRVMIEGEIEYQKYEKDGQTKYFTQINANSVTIVDFTEKKDSSQPNVSASDLPF